MGNKSSRSDHHAPSGPMVGTSAPAMFTPAGSFKKQLLAMDFDHTVCDANTDVEVQDLAENGGIPQSVKDLYSSDCWTDFMQAVFETLHDQGVTEAAMRAYIQRLPLAPGMAQLLDAAGFDTGTDVIIISDANVLFIQWILDFRKLATSVDKIYSNPAQFDENGCLRIQYYHTQDYCQLSTKNMCKGHILQEFMKQREKSHGTKYSKVVYVGDGTNDICPATKLTKHDVLCARKGFKMARSLENHQDSLRCEIVEYEHGKEIAEILKLTVDDSDWLQAPASQLINDT